MVRIKLLGLAIASALAVIVAVGCRSASATVLCKEFRAVGSASRGPTRAAPRSRGL